MVFLPNLGRWDVPRRFPGSLLAHPDYILNAGSDGLPLAEEQPSWLLKSDALVVDARRKDSRCCSSCRLYIKRYFDSSAMHDNACFFPFFPGHTSETKLKHHNSQLSASLTNSRAVFRYAFSSKMFKCQSKFLRLSRFSGVYWRPDGSLRVATSRMLVACSSCSLFSWKQVA